MPARQRLHGVTAAAAIPVTVTEAQVQAMEPNRTSRRRNLQKHGLLRQPPLLQCQWRGNASVSSASALTHSLKA